MGGTMGEFCLKCCNALDFQETEQAEATGTWDLEKYSKFLYEVFQIRIPPGIDKDEEGETVTEAPAPRLKTRLEESVIELILPSTPDNPNPGSILIPSTSSEQTGFENGADVSNNNDVEMSSAKEEAPTISSDELPFCTKCKKDVEILYTMHEEMTQMTQKYEDARDKFAATMVDTFFEKCEALHFSAFRGRLKNSVEVLEKWKHRYTGKASEENRMNYLLEEKDLEVVERERSIRRAKEFADTGIYYNPQPYGLSAMQLSKIQQAMTVCYFTPKMRVIRRRNRLYFRVGVKPEPKEVLTHSCKVCLKEFPRLDTLNIHRRTHFSIKRRRKGHRRSRFEQQKLDQSGVSDKSFFCEICVKGFSDKISLDAHFEVKHKGKLPFKCGTCLNDEGFKDSKDLRKHMVEAHPEKFDPKLSCEFCWNTYPTPEVLQEHISRVHERYKCHVCSRIFKLGDHLKRHMYIHTGEKPFRCSRCPKSFNQESNLKEHMYRHTGIRPHKCPLCESKGYLRRVHLKEHMLKEHGTDNIPLLPMGRASQNARKSGQHPVPDPTNDELPEAEPEPDQIRKSSSVNFPIIVSTSSTSVGGSPSLDSEGKPLVVNSLANPHPPGFQVQPQPKSSPIIMRNILPKARESPKGGPISNNNSNTGNARLPTINIKSENPSTTAEMTGTDPSQQYIIYL